jgi:hydroxypyruvate isomerase
VLKFCANLTMLFGEADFLSRFKLAAEAGFTGVEYLFPYPWEKDRLVELLGRYGLEQVLHNLPAGDWAAGERGVACIPGREQEFRDGVGLALEYAKALGCRQLNCLAGLLPANVSREKAFATLAENLLFAARALDGEGIRFLIEPLNSVDMPGFSVVHTADALELIREIGHPNLWIQYDVYHMQIMEGNLTRTIVSNLDRISHIQVADNPGRNEPGTGEINYPYLLKSIEAAGYDGWIGCEYKPAAGTMEGLGWIEVCRAASGSGGFR